MRGSFDFSFSVLNRYCRTHWLTLLALFKFRRLAIHSCRHVVHPLIIPSIATVHRPPVAALHRNASSKSTCFSPSPGMRPASPEERSALSTQQEAGKE